MIGDIKKAKKADLAAELALYVKAGIAGVVETGTNADMAAEIVRLQAEHGHPVLLDAEFIKENATLAKILMDQGAQADSIVFAEETDLETSRKLDLEASRRDEIVKELAELGHTFGSAEEVAQLTTTQLEAKLEDMKSKVAGPSAGHGQATGAAVAHAVAQEAAEMVYTPSGKTTGITVVRTTDVVLHGKSYKEILLANGEGYRLSPEEYAQDVKPRA